MLCAAWRENGREGDEISYACPLFLAVPPALPLNQDSKCSFLYSLYC
jgi:hypothetical protein